MYVNDAYLYDCFKPGTPLYFYRLRPDQRKIRPWIANALGVKRAPAGKDVPPDVMYIIDAEGKQEIVGIFDDYFEESGEFVLRALPGDISWIAEAEVLAELFATINPSHHK